MSEFPTLAADAAPAELTTPGPAALPSRAAALIQVLVCAWIPTQIVVGVGVAAVFYAINVPILDAQTKMPTLEFIAMTSLIDTAFVAVLIHLFLAASGETAHDVFIGSRPVGAEFGVGLALVPLLVAGVSAIVLGVRALVPSLHNVAHSDFENFLGSPLDAAIFGVVTILAGGVREELQRGFILHRFRQRLGGARAGLIASSLVFGVTHAAEQGWDVAVAMCLLGALWAWIYLKRGSVVMSMTSHAGFDALQILEQMVVKSIGAS